MAEALADMLPPFTGSWFTKTLHTNIPPNLEPSSQSLPSPFVAVVTGASRGIGAAIALAFAKAGASGILITARKASSLEDTKKACEAAAKSSSLKIVAVEADAGRDEAIAIKIAEAVQKEFGRLDVLVNNAGILSTDASAFERELDKVQADQITIPTDVNYIGRFLTMKHLIPILLASPNGAKAVVSISSVGSHLFGAGNVGFSISALANNRLIEAAADRYKEQGLMCYSVHPGAVYSTPPPGAPAWLLDHSKDDVGLCGAFLVWLLKEDREWLSGRYMHANWDVSELEAKREEIVSGDKLKFRMVI